MDNDGTRRVEDACYRRERRGPARRLHSGVVFGINGGKIVCAANVFVGGVFWWGGHLMIFFARRWRGSYWKVIKSKD
jgi:hypothetical protein